MQSESVSTGPKFPLGKVLITPGAGEALTASGQDVWTFLYRHQSGDWGDIGLTMRRCQTSV
ncbi:MAG TPA: hypothetical protein VG722_10740 [Tepidisphaeraceae bacterium]|nr:hypothetical protein [Tepidisphaeraceae bacterium]